MANQSGRKIKLSDRKLQKLAQGGTIGGTKREKQIAAGIIAYRDAKKKAEAANPTTDPTSPLPPPSQSELLRAFADADRAASGFIASGPDPAIIAAQQRANAAYARALSEASGGKASISGATAGVGKVIPAPPVAPTPGKFGGFVGQAGGSSTPGASTLASDLGGNPEFDMINAPSVPTLAAPSTKPGGITLPPNIASGFGTPAIGKTTVTGGVVVPPAPPKGGQTIDPNAPNLPRLPYKPGGYTTADMEAAYGGQNVAPAKTGFDYGQLSIQDQPKFAARVINDTNHAYAGYYQAPNGNWYPIDQKKIDAYNADKGKGGGGGGGGGGGTTPGAGGSYNVEGAPNWWSGILIPNATTEEQKYANILNGSIPFMSPEDQQTAANYLATNFPEFAKYKNVAFEAPPPEVTTAVREKYTSRDRAQQLVDTLLKISEASGLTEDQMGPGYQYIKQVADILSRFGGGAMGTSNYQTREQYQQMLTALDPLLNQGQGANSPYAQYLPIAQNLYNPTFSAGPLWNLTKNPDGSYSFGAPNSQLY